MTPFIKISSIFFGILKKKIEMMKKKRTGITAVKTSSRV
jgi:hypothetical protein